MPKGQYTRTVRPFIHIIGPSIAYIQLTKGLLALVDSDTAPILSRWNWSAMMDGGKKYFYAARSGPKGDTPKLTILMHRVILGDHLSPRIGDHRNGNTLDNRRCNLRWCSKLQNVINRSVSSVGKSGRWGINPLGRKWRVRITVNGRRLELGILASLEEAIKVREAAEEKYFGEFIRRETMPSLPASGGLIRD